MTKCLLPKKIILSALNICDFNINEISEGIAKQVYKISSGLNNYILYIYRRPYENKLFENSAEGADYLWPDGLEYFIYNTQLLSGLGVRVPRIIKTGHYDAEKFDYAFVECFEGKSLAQYMQDGGDIKSIAGKIISVTEKMFVKKRDFYGPPLITKPLNIQPTELLYNIESEELNFAAKLDKEVMEVGDKIRKLLQDLKSKICISDNNSYCLIHGELSPPHIWILNDGTIGLIDIEAIKYFDIEYDMAWIELMYNGVIPLPENIDVNKLDFYKLCLKIGFISVGVDYITNVDKNNAFFKGIRDSNLKDLKEMF